MEPSGGPVGPPGGTDAERLARRYGKRASGARAGRAQTTSSRAAWIGGGIVAVGVAVVVGWLSFAGTSPPATLTDAAYTVLSDSEVTLTFDVQRNDPSLPVRCSVEALDSTHAQVGAKDVEVPAGTEQSVTVTVVVQTFARSETAKPIDGSCFAQQ